jgi:hypothetical protein
MLKQKKTHRVTTLIALLAAVAALASAPAATAASIGLGSGFQPDASWAEGA